MLRRAIDKWLKAGVMERGVLTHPNTGTPQGGVVSPLLANVYLHARSPDGGKRDARPGTFDLLGFTHYWARSYRGYMVIKRQTARSRLRRALARATLWCRINLHLLIAEQQRSLNLRLRGHYGTTASPVTTWR